MAMNYQQIHFFLQAAKYGSFSNAAQTLYVSRQALIKQIARLEEQLGGKLLESSSHGVRLTDFGSYALPRLEKLDREYAAVFTELRQYAREAREQVRLGIFSGIPRDRAVNPLLRFLSDRFPGCRLEPELLSRGEGRRRLEQGELDLLLTHIHEEELWDGFRRLVFRQAPAEVCVSRSHPWAELEQVDRADLARAPCIMQLPEHGPRPAPDRRFFDGIPCLQRQPAKNFETLLTLLDQGDAFAVLPASMCHMDLTRYRLFPYPGRQFLFSQVLVCRRDEPRETVRQMAEAAAAEYGLYDL